MSTAPALTCGYGSSSGSISSIINLWLGDETGARSKLDLPTDIWMEAHRDWLAVKLRTAWTVGGQDLCAGHGARHIAVGFSGRRPQFYSGFRAGTAARAAGLVLERRKTGAADPRRIAAGVRSLDAVGGWLDPRQPAGITRDRRRRRLAARYPRIRKQWRPARQHPGSADAVLTDADRSASKARRC